MPDVQIVEGTVFFDPADPIYRDHFPGRPVVPGSLMAAAFLEAAGAAGWLGGKARVIRNMKFKAFVTPGTYTYRLTAEPAGIRCRLFDKDHEYVSGEIGHGV